MSQNLPVLRAVFMYASVTFLVQGLYLDEAGFLRRRRHLMLPAEYRFSPDSGILISAGNELVHRQTDFSQQQVTVRQVVAICSLVSK